MTMDTEEVTSKIYQLDGLSDNDTSDLPSSLIITSIDISVFHDADCRTEFEDLFKQYDSEAQFFYYKSFRRARVNMQQSSDAARARIGCHGYEVCGSIINCYFAQVSTPDRDGYSSPSNKHLHPPKPEKMFLISPPASPPVGWEPTPESQPVFNRELLSALANLQPGETHELHPASKEQPGIIVHTCEQEESAVGQPKITQTKCPERPS